MTHRYEFTGETKMYYGRTLRQIRATVDLPGFGVRVGDLGGWIEREENFPQSSRAWVFPDARVMGTYAVVLGGTIRGGTIEGGTISGGTIRGGTIWGGTIRGGTIWGGTIEGGDSTKLQPLFLAGLRWPVTITDKHMTIGCQHHALGKWWKFADRTIEKMDSCALEFWRAHKATLQALCAATGRDSGASVVNTNGTK